MKKLILSTCALLAALCVFVVYQVVAEPKGGATASDAMTQRAKVAAGANANARLSLDLIANGRSGNESSRIRSLNRLRSATTR